MEGCFNKRISIEKKVKISQNLISDHHHTSLQYRASFMSKNPIFRRTSNSQIVSSQKINKQEIFSLVYRFLGKVLTNSTYFIQILHKMKFELEDKNISVTKISDPQSSVQNSQNSINSNPNGQQITQIISYNQKQNKISPKNIRILQEKKSLEYPKKQVRQPKISIMLGTLSDYSLGSGSKISCTSSIHISSIKFPVLVLTLEMIKKIFQQPQPFLINLALCLMLKFLFYSKMTLNGANSCWILGIATIVAYKIYYDEPVGGLIQSFANILQINSKQIMDLERYFLDQISFQAVITNQQYHQILTQIAQND